MKELYRRLWSHRPSHRASRIIILAVTGLAIFASYVLPLAFRPSGYELAVGDVAPYDIQAPYALSYESEVLTERARAEMEKKVSSVYLPADPAISRQQIEKMRSILYFINTVRQDAYASFQQKVEDLSMMVDIKITPAVAEQLINLSTSRWESVQREAESVLEQMMRNTIREDRLAEYRRNVPSLISYSVPPEASEVIINLVTPMVVANSLFSQEQTEAARQDARESVAPVMQSFMVDEAIVLRGQVIGAKEWEALLKYELVQLKTGIREMAGAAAVIILMGGFLTLYFRRRFIAPADNLLALMVIAAMMILFLLAARIFIPNRAVLPYLFPLPAFGLTLAAMYSSVEIAMIFSLVISILAAYGLPNTLDLTVFYFMSSLCGVLILGRGRRMVSFVFSALAVGVAGGTVVLAYRLPDGLTDWFGLATLLGTAFLNGVFSTSLALVLQFLFSWLTGTTTALQLLELSRPDHPLLQYILRNAPGTYQHSLQVANLAEQAAEAIGADALLVRVGALYHDAGKANNPQFFIENQAGSRLNPHDDLDPAFSASVIIQHVSDGDILARKHRLPAGIRAFILEHHGTLLTRYQYARAIEKSDGHAELVSQAAFRYPGPRPKSRETALLMLADGVEARARATVPKNHEELRDLIKQAFDYYEHEGQLDETRLTLRDLNLASESFFNTLKGMYHPRIHYPEIKQKQPAAGQPQPEPEKLPGNGS
ncbi:MAG TPA: HDIG domain-containing protein [Anaerolineaceae bacterium]|nr:HDIG domain-containing protein [Anaerolineaceae bacterium]HPN53294.1 HDIG domain-containing protein [Anaerolineaceae bacterium]